MKYLVVALLALCSASWAGQLIQLNGTTLNTFPAGACGDLAGNLTNALNKATPTVKSSVIDTLGYTGYFISVTSSVNLVGGPVVVVEFSPLSYTGWVDGYKLIGAGSSCAPKLNRWMRLYNASGPLGTTITGAYSNLSVTVSYIAGSSGIGKSAAFTATTGPAQTWLTYTASVYNVSTTAGTAGLKYAVTVSPNFGGSMVRVGYGTSATPPTDLYSTGIPIQTSASAQAFGPFVEGTNFYVIGAGAASVTGRIYVDTLP